MPRKAARRKRISAEGMALKTVRFKFWITGDSGILGSGVAENCSQKPDAYPLMPPFAASVFLQLPSIQMDMAEACGSRIRVRSLHFNGTS